MTELGPEARSLIDQAEGVDSPSSADKGRVRSRLALQMGIAAVGVAAGATAKASATGVGAKLGGAAVGGGGAALAAKLLVGVAIVSVVAFGASRLGPREQSTEHRVQRSETAATGMGGTTPETTSVVGRPAPASTTESSLAETAPNGATPAPASSVVSRVNEGKPAVSAPTTSATTGEVSAMPSAPRAPPDGEAALMRKAEAAIAVGDGVKALQLIELHEKRFPNGLLADQRESNHVLALCTIGKVPAARAAAERHLAEHPRSSQADRIRRVCGVP